MNNIADHNKTVLMFSGGKDSMACLFILEELGYKDIEIVWVDTGKNFKMILDTIEWTKKRFSQYKFIRLVIDRDFQWEKEGLPVDAMNLDYSKEGNRVLNTTIKFQSRFNCCFKNIMLPVLEYIHANNVSHLARGMKLSDKAKDTSRHGQVIEGVTIINPIEDWTDDKVREYLKSKMDGYYPKHFVYSHSSLDCMDCTAYLGETPYKTTLLQQENPEQYEIFTDNLFNIRHSILEQVNHINKIL